MALKWKDVAAIGTSLPGVVESTSYGTPSLKIVKTFFTRYRHEDDSIVIKMPMDERDMRIEVAPEIYFLTDHYRPWPTVLVRLSTVSKEEVKALLTRSWHELAPKKLKAAAAGESAAAKPAAPLKRPKA